MPKFDIKEHERRMREILNPPQTSVPLIERLKQAARKRRPPQLPKAGV